MKVILLICLVGIAAAQRWSWESCSSTNAVTINKLTLTPDPINIPGEANLELDITLNQDIMDARLSIKAVQLGFFLDLKLPCVENIGSCSYPQLCNILPRMEKENWAGIGTASAQAIREGAQVYVGELPSCGQSLKAQRLQISEKLKIESIPKILSFISGGEYDVNISVTDNQTNKNIGCVNIKAEIKDNSSFWGRRRRSLH